MSQHGKGGTLGEWGSEVIVTRARLHRELEGRRGTLEQPPQGSQLAAVLRIGSEGWRIARAEDWELTPAPRLGMQQGQEFFLWGEELHVKRSEQYPQLVGAGGTLEAPRAGDLCKGAESVGIFRLGAARYLICRDNSWAFERGPDSAMAALERAAAGADHELTAAEHAAGVDGREPLRRSREVYDHMAFTCDLDAAVKEIRDLLVQKNQAYGNSALDPVRIFSKADPMEQLFVRIDDKLSRLKRGHAAGEDVVKDLQGYLLLVRVAQMRAERNKT